jgi:predicted HNH restriction endonuclease
MADIDVEGLDADGTPYKDPEVLRELYVERGLSQVEIADILGCADCTVSKYRREFGIERDYKDADWLREQYHTNELSLAEIAEKCDAHLGTIQTWMDKHGIERRTISESRTDGDVGRLHDRDWLREQYCKRERTTTGIAEELNVTSATVSVWLDRHDIEARNSVSAPGEGNPNWAGGYEKYYGANWERKRTEALERDGFACLVCGVCTEEHRKRYNRGLDVHHVRPIRTFDEPEDANTLDNLVTLCDRCHKRWEGIPLRPEIVD